MTTTTEAMQKALDALEARCGTNADERKPGGAIHALRSALSAQQVEPVAPLNDIKATMFHDEGAIAQCGHCKRYTLDRRALSDRQPVCDCGKQHYWSGSFTRPGPDAQWFGATSKPARDAGRNVQQLTDAQRVSAARAAGCRVVTKAETDILMRLSAAIEAACAAAWGLTLAAPEGEKP